MNGTRFRMFVAVAMVAFGLALLFVSAFVDYKVSAASVGGMIAFGGLGWIRDT